MYVCPNCGSSELEKRGQRRVYAFLDDDLQVDGWNEGDPAWIDWDTDDEHNVLVYCTGCESEFTETAIRENTLGHCEECGTFGVDTAFKGADGRSVCDSCRGGDLDHEFASDRQLARELGEPPESEQP